MVGFLGGVRSLIHCCMGWKGYSFTSQTGSAASVIAFGAPISEELDSNNWYFTRLKNTR